jgi:hypothetical protein
MTKISKKDWGKNQFLFLSTIQFYFDSRAESPCYTLGLQCRFVDMFKKYNGLPIQLK